VERDRQDDPLPSADPLKPLFKAGPPSTGTVRPDRLRLTGGTAVRAFRILALFILTPSVVAAQASIRVLEDFERDDALEAWQLRQIDAVVELAADSVGSTVTSLAAAAAREPDRRLRLTYQKWQAGQNKWPSARLSFGDGLFDLDDWSGYETLLFEAWNSHSRTALVKIRIDDADGDRSIQLVAVPPRVWTTCEIRLNDLRSNTDLDAIGLLDFYMTQPERDYRIIIDDIRLEAGPLRITNHQVSVDPFGRGFRATVAFNRHANVSMELLDGDGTGAIVQRFKGSGTRITWRSKGERLQPGAYTIRLITKEIEAESTHNLTSFEVGSESPQLVAWLEPSTQKVRLNSWPGTGKTTYNLLDTASSDCQPARLQMVRNEHEALQLVILGRRGTSVEVTIDSLRHANGHTVLPTADITALQVGYVKTGEPAEYDVDSPGWWPDPLLPKTRMAALPDENMPIWISVRSRKETPPGLYRGLIKLGLDLESDSSSVWQLPFEVDVHESTLPDTTTVRTAFSLRRFMLDKVYGKTRARRMYRPYARFVADHRLNVTDLYRSSPPPLYEVAGAARAGLLNAFNLMQVNAEHADSLALNELSARLDPYVRQLRRMGIAHRAYIYGFDEVASDGFEQLRQVFGFLKKRYPEVKTVTTARDPSYGLETGLAAVVDVWVPAMALYDEQAADLARHAGEEIWWYIYVAPPHPFANWFVEYPALEARLLWWMTYQRGVNGFLYYYLNRWPNQVAPMSLDAAHNLTAWDPASFGTANGDGCLFYAGPAGPITTIRFESIRDGIEEFELLHMLTERKVDGGKAARQLCDILARSLTDYSDESNLFLRTRVELIERLEEAR
jgi:hypothetical protein